MKLTSLMRGLDDHFTVKSTDPNQQINTGAAPLTSSRFYHLCHSMSSSVKTGLIPAPPSALAIRMSGPEKASCLVEE